MIVHKSTANINNALSCSWKCCVPILQEFLNESSENRFDITHDMTLSRQPLLDLHIQKK